MDLKIMGGFGVRLPDGRMKKGDVVAGHAHNFPHVTYIPHGAALFEELDDDDNAVRSVVKRASDGYNFLLILAGKRHRITAMEDGTDYHCLYVHRSPDGEISDAYDGWAPAYS